jgi:hypothetical protein
MKKIATWMFSPTLKQLTALCLIWVVGLGLLLGAMTNFFSDSLRNRQYLILGALTTFGLIKIIFVFANYLRTKRG